jgi:O-antigen ligase
MLLLRGVVMTAVIVTAIAMQPGAFDVFRTPKDIALYFFALLLFTIGAAGVLLNEPIAQLFGALPKHPLFLAVAAATWTAVVTMTSLRPGASFWAPLTVTCFAVLFCAALFTANDRYLPALLVVFVPALVNSIVAAGQSTRLWSPWEVNPAIPMRLRTTGMVGNPNDLGTYLVIPALAALAAGLAWPKRRWMLGIALILIVGIASAQSVTPFGAAIAGVFIMVFTSRTKRLRMVVVGATLVLIAAAAIHPASRERFRRLAENASSGQLPEMTSFRVMPAVTAFEMFLDHPIVGVGPGTFSSTYMTYKLRTDEKYPQWVRLGNESFGQVHNDHMQILAESGLPGYLLFLAGLALLASLSFRRPDPDANDGQRFAAIFALPAAGAFAVLAIAQFPMQLTAPLVPVLYLAALCFAWTTPVKNAVEEDA